MKKYLLALLAGTTLLTACGNNEGEKVESGQVTVTQEHKDSSLAFTPDVKGTKHQLNSVTLPSEENMSHYTLEESKIIEKTADPEDMPEVEGFTQQTITYEKKTENGGTLPEQISVPLEIFDKVQVGDKVTLYKDDNFDGLVQTVKYDTLPELYTK